MMVSEFLTSSRKHKSSIFSWSMTRSIASYSAISFSLFLNLTKRTIMRIVAIKKATKIIIIENIFISNTP